MVFAGSRMGNRIYSYSGSGENPVWTSISLQGASLGDLATDDQYLYALIFPDGDPLSSSVIRRFNPSNMTWDMQISSNDYSIQSIYGAGGYLFAGGQSKTNRNHFSVLYMDGSSSSLTVSIAEGSLLTGAVNGASGIYLATMGGGIFLFNRGAIMGPLNGTGQAAITGIIETGGTIIAVGSTGYIYHSNATTFNRIQSDFNYTGALNIWLDRNNQGRPSLLLMGIRGTGSSLNNGYREMILNNGVPTFVIKTPGDDSPTSVKNKAKYTGSIGVHPVQSIIQVPSTANGGPLNYDILSRDPEWEPPIFAATSKDGLWSYRNGEWNAED
jgi:hypothetical protein